MSNSTAPEASQRELTEDELNEVRGGRGGRDTRARGSNERSYNRSQYRNDPDSPSKTR